MTPDLRKFARKKKADETRPSQHKQVGNPREQKQKKKKESPPLPLSSLVALQDPRLQGLLRRSMVSEYEAQVDLIELFVSPFDRPRNSVSIRYCTLQA
jgi:hypothetical protein